MSTTKHTAEPWAVDGDGFHADITYNDIETPDDEGGGIGLVARDVEHANAARIVQCVNACQGIPDPAAALQQAREALEWWAAHARTLGLVHERKRALDALRALGGTP